MAWARKSIVGALPVRQPHVDLAPHVSTIVVGLQARGVNAVDRELPVAILGVSGHPDRADDLPADVADLHAAALRKELVIARGDQIAHEGRLLLVADAHEPR